MDTLWPVTPCSASGGCSMGAAFDERAVAQTCGNEWCRRSYQMTQSNQHDPYREVEMYLEQAQEEIGRAFADLEEFESNVSEESSDSWWLSSDTLQREDDPPHLPSTSVEFPRPPSGDMNLLSAWADTFSDEVNRTLQCDDVDFAETINNTFPKPKSDQIRAGIRRGTNRSFRCPAARRTPLRRHWSCPNDLPFWSDPTRCLFSHQESRLENLLSKLLHRDLMRRDVRDVEVQTSCENCSSVRTSSDKSGAQPSKDDDGQEACVSTVQCVRLTEAAIISHLLQKVRCRTVRWLSDEDDSDCLESKELPKSLDKDGETPARTFCLVDVHPAVRAFLQKSPASTISSSSHVSRQELECFLRKVEMSVYQPPPSDQSDDRSGSNSPQQDAITQTSPDLSPSSSFTWVTECDCSEPDRRKSYNTLSDDSFPSFSCSSDTRESSSSSSSEDTSEQPTAVVMSSSLSLSSLSSGDKLLSQTAIERKKIVEPSRLLIREFKSSSAPLLPDRDAQRRLGRRASESDQDHNVLKKAFSHPRSHSAKELSELEAAEACGWLRAAGFPQYAQMYEDNLFPIDISSVRKDHEFLDPDSIQSLFRRLNTLNKCARLKNDGFSHRKSLVAEDSDEEDHCALSENWQFQRSNRRWSRISPPSPSGIAPISPKHVLVHKYLSPSTAYCSSHDSVFLDDSPEVGRRVPCEGEAGHPVPMEECSANSSPLGGSEVTLERPCDHSPLRRTGSERLKDSAKAFLRRVESLKGKRKKKNREIVIIGSPIGYSDSSANNPAVQINLDYLVDSDMGTPDVRNSRKGWHGKDEAHSDSECSHLSTSPNWTVGESFTANGHAGKERKGKRRNGSSSSQEDSSTSGNENCSRQQVKRTQWLSPDSKQQDERHSLYDNVPGGDGLPHSKSPPSQKAKSDEQDAGSLASTLACISDQETPGSQEEIDIHRMTMERRDSGVGSSLTRTIGGSPSLIPRWHCFPSAGKRVSTNPISQGCPVSSLSAPQLMVVRKFSLLKLTALMEKYSPSNRTGWNWGVPKFIRRIRAPDYKDKSVFGVPLLLIVQRTGHPIPPPILAAMRYLRKTALDSTGLFRKSGVRSRIQKLRNLTEGNPDSVSYENQQSYDVADMLKQYFRELPEALLTNKLSETFISIFQHIPEELRLEATQAAILLMPDENREALQSLLAFLKEVCEHSDENQMTATNLAVCFAPSLFHLNTPRSASVSPRRRKTVGIPDQRELNENRAAHECLNRIISEYKRIFTVPEDAMLHCRLSCLEQCEPAPLEDLGGSKSNWRSYMEVCTQDLLKEARDKFKGWVTMPHSDNVDLAYKKVGDGHPLRLWKISVEVEAPPVELLHRILRERHIWDENLLKWKVVTKLEKHAEIFQYVCGSIPPHCPQDFCVLRTWRTDLPKGTCVMVETSVDHPEAEILMEGVRGVVLASRYLIEPCGSGKSRITHISRIDTRGRSLEWYNKAYGHIQVVTASRIRDSFKHGTEGPETKV